MNLPLRLLRSRLGSSPGSVPVFATALAAAGAIVALAVLARFIDGAALGDLMANAADDPDGALLAVGAFGTAFLLRSVAWRRLLPALSLGQSLAAIHVALGANHVLPFRLGEPMRVVSALARTPVSTTAATATGVALRLGDILGLLFIAAIIAPSALLDALGLAGSALAAVASVAAVGAIVVVFRMAARRTDLQRPDATVAVLTLIAWWFESVLVWRVAGWGGVDLSLRDALLVTVVAVAAQLVAIAPGGIGSYEAAAVAAMVFVGVDPGQALVVAVAAHLLKTLYSVISGIVFTFGLLLAWCRGSDFRLRSQLRPSIHHRTGPWCCSSPLTTRAHASPRSSGAPRRPPGVDRCMCW